MSPRLATLTGDAAVPGVSVILHARAFSGVLGTAGSPGEQFVEIERNIAQAMGNITDEAF